MRDWRSDEMMYRLSALNSLKRDRNFDRANFLNASSAVMASSVGYSAAFMPSGRRGVAS